MKKIIKLQIQSNQELLELNIKKHNNCILVQQEGLFKIYCSFREVTLEKNKNYSIKIDNKLLNSKEYVLINLLDYNSIRDNLTNKKGSLLLEYFCEKIKNLDFIDTDIILEKIVDIGKKIVTESGIQISFEIDENITKIIFEILKFQNNAVNFDEIIQSIQFLLYETISLNIMKTYIVFYDSSFLPLIFNNYENVLSFNVSKSEEIYNLISLAEVKELNISKIKNEIEKVWPLSCNEKFIDELLYEYYHSKISLNRLFAKTEEEVIFFNIMNKLLNFHKEIKWNIQISNNIKSFLIDL